MRSSIAACNSSASTIVTSGSHLTDAPPPDLPAALAGDLDGADPIVNLDYFDTVNYANLWEGRCHRLAGLGHAPFWEAPGEFTPVLEHCVQDVETGRAATRIMKKLA